jgi:CheY-specific phosphatase CheX
VVVQLSEERYKDIDNMALSLLEELNNIVNKDLIKL